MAYIVEREFEHAGYKCVVIFTNMGRRCGYVGVPKESKLYGKNYRNLDFDVHGGLSFSNCGKISDYPIKSDLGWLGFDCGHAFDRPDYEYAIKLFPSEKEHLERLAQIDRRIHGEIKERKDVIRSEEYVAEECKRLAEQIKEYEERED